MLTQSCNSHVCEEKSSKPRGAPKLRRDRDAIHLAMLKAANAGHVSEPAPTTGAAMPSYDRRDIGLTQQELEDRRWGLSPSVAKERLLSVGLRYEGRRAGLIYSWPSIFRAEGVEDSLGKAATREQHPELYDDLIDTSEAATLLGYRDASSIRKLIGSGDIPGAAYIKFGTRGVYRFRPALLQAMPQASLEGRIV